jgi:hypothetical protein
MNDQGGWCSNNIVTLYFWLYQLRFATGYTIALISCLDFSALHLPLVLTSLHCTPLSTDWLTTNWLACHLLLLGHVHGWLWSSLSAEQFPEHFQWWARHAQVRWCDPPAFSFHNNLLHKNWVIQCCCFQSHQDLMIPALLACDSKPQHGLENVALLSNIHVIIRQWYSWLQAQAVWSTNPT